MAVPSLADTRVFITLSLRLIKRIGGLHRECQSSEPECSEYFPGRTKTAVPTTTTYGFDLDALTNARKPRRGFLRLSRGISYN